MSLDQAYQTIVPLAVTLVSINVEVLTVTLVVIFVLVVPQYTVEIMVNRDVLLGYTVIIIVLADYGKLHQEPQVL